MLVKIVAFQGQMGRPLSLDEKILIFKQRPDFVCLPEYFQLDDSVDDFQRAALMRNDHLEYLTRLSEELDTCVIGGTLVDAIGDCLYNTCYVINRGRCVGRYRKRYPVENEQRRGISAGDETVVVLVDGVRIGLMICGDVFNPVMYDELRQKDADLIVIPTTSPYREHDTVSDKTQRDRQYFLDGARRSGTVVIKVCGVGQLFGKPLQGRSLIAAPWGLMKRVDYANESKVRLLSATIAIDEVREFRRRQPATVSSVASRTEQ
ncbi:hypothetical protein GF377_05755 [candidate division GN15 bacterium]|nr:hypothetical protein [candidate division GN15 bacterium]